MVFYDLFFILCFDVIDISFVRYSYIDDGGIKLVTLGGCLLWIIIFLALCGNLGVKEGIWMFFC